MVIRGKRLSVLQSDSSLCFSPLKWCLICCFSPEQPLNNQREFTYLQCQKALIMALATALSQTNPYKNAPCPAICVFRRGKQCRRSPLCLRGGVNNRNTTHHCPLQAICTPVRYTVMCTQRLCSKAQ